MIHNPRTTGHGPAILRTDVPLRARQRPPWRPRPPAAPRRGPRWRRRGGLRLGLRRRGGRAVVPRSGGGHRGGRVDGVPPGRPAAARDERLVTAADAGRGEEPIDLLLEVPATAWAEAPPVLLVLGEAPPGLWEAACGGQPVVLTRDGAPALVVLDLDSYREAELAVEEAT
jgi:hypothetical protein